MQAWDYNGIWWLPENPSENVAGTLRFSEGAGIVLSLSGTLGEAGGPGKKTIPILLGMIYDCPLGSEATLRNCWVKTLHMGSHGLTREDYHVERLLIGDHLETEDAFLFSDMSVSFSGLSSWADRLTGLSHKSMVIPESHSVKFDISWQAPEPIRGAISGGTLSLRAGGKLSMLRRDWGIKETLQFSIKCTSPMSDDALNKNYIYPLQNFLTLATDHPNARRDLTVRRPGSQTDIHVFGALVFHDDESAADLTPHKMLFLLEDVKDRMIELIGRWFELSEQLRGVCNPYFGILYKPSSYVDTRFLTVYQSLEVYDRLRGGANRHNVQNSSQNGEHLARLIREHESTIAPLFRDNVQEAVANLLRYRNFVVHRDSPIGDDPEYGRELFWLTQRLMFLMKACFLTELGIADEEQLKFFRRNQMYLHILGLTSE
jgi:hypothetical protein